MSLPSSSIAPTATPSAMPTASQDLTAECVTAIPGPNGHVPPGACNGYYNFDPAPEPAAAVAVLFALLTAVHVTEAFVFKKRYTWVLIMGALWETIGFILHAVGARDQQNIGYATGHAILYLLAPLWINAFVYMTLSRMVFFYLPPQKVGPLRATGMSKWFVIADILTFIVQGAGGIMASPGGDPNTIKSGLNVYLVGLGFQEFFIVCFLGLMIVFHRQSLALDAASMGRGAGVDGFGAGAAPKRSWKPLLYTLYAVLTFISIRIFFRIAEFGGGIKESNPIPFHEEYSYALDAFPMMVALLLLAVVHPGRSLVGPESEFPKTSRKEKKAAKQAKKDEKAGRKAAKTAKGGAGAHVQMNHYPPEYSTSESGSSYHQSVRN